MSERISLSVCWSKACENCKIPTEVANRWLKTIYTKYNTEKHRFYHNIRMLDEKCEFLLTFGPTISFSDCLIFAIFFQYYNFDWKSESSVIESNCRAFQKFHDEAAIQDEKLFTSVVKLLNNSDTEIDDILFNVQLYQDLDLIVLGSEPEKYRVYRDELQKEYSHLNESEYRKTRLRILETFLQIPQIYTVPCIHQKLEDKARENIKKEIDDLKN